MEIPDLPDRLQFGRVALVRGTGPVTTQRTSVVQRPGDELVFEKTLDPFVTVGDALPLTLLEIEDTLLGPSVDEAIDRWYAEAAGVAGFVSALLDERLFQRPVLEDVVIFDEEGREVIGAADARMRVRHFLPYPISDHELEALDNLGADVPAGHPGIGRSPLVSSSSSVGSPVADGVVFLWIAVDALLGTDGERVVPALHARFDELEIDLPPCRSPPGGFTGYAGTSSMAERNSPPACETGSMSWKH